VRDNADKFNCKKCTFGHHCDDDMLWPESIGPSTNTLIEIQRDGFELKSKTCLLPKITDRTNNFFKLYKHYSKGVLLVAGGLYDQPAIYIEAMDIIGN